MTCKKGHHFLYVVEMLNLNLSLQQIDDLSEIVMEERVAKRQQIFVLYLLYTFPLKILVITFICIFFFSFQKDPFPCLDCSCRPVLRMSPPEVKMEIFFSAIHSGHQQCVLRLLKIGASINDIYFGETSLQHAIFGNQIRMMKFLLNCGAHLEASDKWGFTSLLSASSVGNYEAVEYLLSKGANVNYRTYNGITALSCAAENYHVLQLLVDCGADVNVGHKYFPLHQTNSISNYSYFIYALRQKRFPDNVTCLILGGAKVALKDLSLPEHKEAFLFARSCSICLQCLCRKVIRLRLVKVNRNVLCGVSNLAVPSSVQHYLLRGIEMK